MRAADGKHRANRHHTDKNTFENKLVIKNLAVSSITPQNIRTRMLFW
jgi:hypothetical protein